MLRRRGFRDRVSWAKRLRNVVSSRGQGRTQGATHGATHGASHGWGSLSLSFLRSIVQFLRIIRITATRVMGYATGKSLCGERICILCEYHKISLGNYKLQV